MSLDKPEFPPAAGHRFHVPPDAWPDNATSLTLTGQESRHCAEILRHRCGDRVTAFDGRGRVAACDISEIARREVALNIVNVREIPRPSSTLILAQSIAKTKAMDWLVQKATEIGVTHIVPLTTARTVVKIGADDAGKHREKWQRIALETAKQCTRSWLPEISDPQPLTTFLRSPPDAALRIIAALTTETQSLKSALGATPLQQKSAAVLIGPEGDFTSAELSAALSAGFLPVSLGSNILRSETAALYTLSVLAHHLGE